MAEKFSSALVYDGEKTWEEYYAQFKTAKPELGKTYVTHPNSWEQRFYQIVYMDEHIALGRSINPFNGVSVEYDLFRASGLNAGWRDCDSRPGYRLQEVDTVKPK